MTSYDPAIHGCVRTLDDGRRYVFFQRTLAHPVAAVWAALTEPEKLANWFPGFRGNIEQGGRFDIWFDGAACEGPSHYGGTITRCEPPHFLQCGTIGYELKGQGSDCQITFTDVLWNEGSNLSPTDLANSVLGGWHNFLDALAVSLAGKTYDHSTAEVNYAAIAIPGRD